MCPVCQSGRWPTVTTEKARCHNRKNEVAAVLTAGFSRQMVAERLLKEQKLPRHLLPEHGGPHALDAESIPFLKEVIPDIVV